MCIYIANNRGFSNIVTYFQFPKSNPGKPAHNTQVLIALIPDNDEYFHVMEEWVREADRI